MKTKDNRQYKKTDLALKAGFVELIEERHMQRITVRDIIEKCGINRSTFYAHFEDMNALMDSLMADTISGYAGIAEDDPEPAPLETLFSPDRMEPIIEQIGNRKGLYLYYIEHSTYHHASKYAERMLDELIVPKIKADCEPPAEHLRYYYAYVVSGTIAIIKEWLSSGTRESPREIAEIICRSMPALPGRRS